MSELAGRMGVEAHLIDSADEIDSSWLKNKSEIGITAGASAPDILVRQVIERLCDLGASAPEEINGVSETITFTLPKELRIIDAKSI